MGFPRKVKEQILVDTARHCCVCHRYKGVKVEVHHIIQEKLGGPNTYQNAIALCFDCHADAGHYNIDHPRGTKFSPAELRKTKKNWLNMVQNSNIKEPSEPDKLLCRYFVCENYENLIEISCGDLSKFPIDNPLLVNNKLLTSLKQIIATHPESYRHANAWGESFSNKESYLNKHPEAHVTNDSDGMYSYFQAVRTPSSEELEKIRHQDGILNLMMEEGIPIKHITSIVAGYGDGCGEDIFQEEYIFRQVWCVFLAITNISDRPFVLVSLEGKDSIKQGFSKFSVFDKGFDIINLPNAPIMPNESAIVPIAIILPPLYALKRDEYSSTSNGGDLGEQLQVVTHESIIPNNIEDFLTYGGQINTKSIRYKLDGNVHSQDIHPFDLTNMYSIDRNWQMGSCPHLFYVNDTASYVRELLALCESCIGEDVFVVPNNVDSIIIAEIEDETTEINSIKIDGEICAQDIVLRNSEFIEIQVLAGSIVQVIGQYLPCGIANKNLPQGIKRNDLVSKFLNDYSKRPNKQLHKDCQTSASLQFANL